MRYYASQNIKNESDWHEQFRRAKEAFIANRNTAKEFEDYDRIWESLWEDFNSEIANVQSQQLLHYEFFKNNPYLNLKAIPKENSNTIEKYAFNIESIMISEATLQVDGADSNDNEWCVLGEHLAQNEMEEKAIVAFRKCLKINPENCRALINLAFCLTNNGLNFEANRILNQWLKNQYNVFAKGEFLSSADVIREFLVAISNDPTATKDSSFQTALGLLQYNSGDYEKALDCFKYALSLDPDNFVLWNTIGATFANAGSNEEAVKNYQKALELNPNFIRAAHNLAICCINIGCFEDAISFCISCLDKQTQHCPDNADYTVECIWHTLKKALILCDKENLVEKCMARDVKYFLSDYNAIPNGLERRLSTQSILNSTEFRRELQ